MHWQWFPPEQWAWTPNYFIIYSFLIWVNFLGMRVPTKLRESR
jgi:hypothetical protein